MPDFYLFSTPESVLFGPIITLRGRAITKSVRLESAFSNGVPCLFVPYSLVNGGGRRSVAAFEQLHRAPPGDELLVGLGGRVGITARKCRNAGRHQSG